MKRAFTIAVVLVSAVTVPLANAAEDRMGNFEVEPSIGVQAGASDTWNADNTSIQPVRPALQDDSVIRADRIGGAAVSVTDPVQPRAMPDLPFGGYKHDSTY